MTLPTRITTDQRTAAVPNITCTAVVQWPVTHEVTTWTAIDDLGNPTSVVRPDSTMDLDTPDTTATVVFLTDAGVFRLVATTKDAVTGDDLRAESLLFSILPTSQLMDPIVLRLVT